VCPLALEPATSRPKPPAALGHLWGDRAVVAVGRMSAAERYKGHDELLECWPAVLQSVPDAKLVFVGDGDDLPRLRDKARTLGVSPALVSTGFVDDEALKDAYRQAALFAMPSRNEGFGLVYLEAMAQGLPCIGSVYDAASEIIVDGVTGFLVDQRKIPTLGDRIVALLRDEPHRRAMGEAGRQRAIQQFSYAQFRDRVAGALTAAFRQRPADAVMVRAE
jgi:phosphatidylinositol alpha-1,6-mannosyltransferase